MIVIIVIIAITSAGRRGACKIRAPATHGALDSTERRLFSLSTAGLCDHHRHDSQGAINQYVYMYVYMYI